MQHFQLFGDIGLGGGEGIDEFSYGFGSPFQFLKEGQAGGFGEDAEEVGDAFEFVVFELHGFGRMLMDLLYLKFSLAQE